MTWRHQWREWGSPIDHFDASLSQLVSVRVSMISTDGYLEARDAKRMDAFIQYGMVAGIQLCGTQVSKLLKIGIELFANVGAGMAVLD